MKRLFFTLIVVFASVNVFSQKINVESGSIDFLKDEQGIYVQFAYDSVKVCGKTEEEYLDYMLRVGKTEYQNAFIRYKNRHFDRINRFEPHFIMNFNTKMNEKNGALITGGEQNASYMMTVSTNSIDPGATFGYAHKSAKINIICTFVDLKTGKEKAVVSITKASSGDDANATNRIQESYAKAGHELAKYFIKQLKLK